MSAYWPSHFSWNIQSLVCHINIHIMLFRSRCVCEVGDTVLSVLYIMYCKHRIIDDRMENSIKGRQIGDNLH